MSRLNIGMWILYRFKDSSDKHYHSGFICSQDGRLFGLGPYRGANPHLWIDPTEIEWEEK